jgi:16S rRNA processing protein RimM
MSANRNKELLMGRVAGVHGVRGWLKVISYTDPRANLLQYRDWSLIHDGKRAQAQLAESRSDGKQVLVRLAGIDDRDQAAELIGAEIWIGRDSLPEPDPGQYYWADLEGLAVLGRDGELLGRVDHVIDAGAQTVMVLEGERRAMIPFVLDEVVTSVDLEKGEIRVLWDASFFDD